MGHATSEFFGTERFRIRRRLGSGGMGVVYEALDRQTDQVVALKALTRTEAPHISRFKHEFRSLADVSHPNLVSLYEFMSDGKYWFFTMELVPGVSFLEYVRPGFRTRRQSQDSVPPTLMIEPELEQEPEAVHFEAETQQFDPERVTAIDESGPENPEVPPVDKSHLDLDRLERALWQLADGLNGLHQTGKLHRDIKPSNVLVTRDGCVKILDFGLVAEVENLTLQENLILAGTPDYMSPEQGAQLPISTASDWYSVGVILYQSLTGRLPFSGQFFEVMMCKQSSDPPPPHELVPDLPRHLSDLCMRLLQRDPSKRPSGNEVIRALGADGLEAFGQPLTTIGGAGLTRRSTFIGRQSQLEELGRAYAAAKNGETISVYLPGLSGIGKSALARHFLAELRKSDPEVVILEGRCYERESVPFKAIDGVIDSLTRFLMSLPDAKAESLTPREIHALAKLFPVMLQVDSVFNAPQREMEIPDPFTLRRRAFAALRELLAQISEHQSLIIWIDDLQWADPDSIILLEELLRPPGSPRLLLLASFRSEDIESKSFLESLLAGTGTKNCRQLKVTPLNRGEGEVLVSSLFGQRLQGVQLIVDSIVREAGGSPFLLEQLSSYAAASEHSSTTGISLAVMLQARLKQLPAGAREFINTLAVAGRPINQRVAFEAAGLRGDELPLVTTLRASQFLRSEGPEQRVELYHDRIRETLASQLDPLTVKQIHRRLAQAIESRGLDDPESLFEHFLGAGERVRAANYAAVAARKAKAKLAFDQAAVFFRRALELAPARGADLLDMKRELADALANAGRPAEAALTYLELAAETSESRSLDFKRRAAQQFLMGGHITEGLQILRSLLSAVGFSLPRGPQAALLSLIFNRLKIRLRGLEFDERPESNISGSTLVRIDTCWAVAAGLGMVDLIYGADFQSRHLLLALRAGEPYRIARALALEAVQIAASGVRSRNRALQLAQKAEELAQRVANPHAIGLALWARGLIAYLAGHWRNASELCERAAEVLRDECTGRGLGSNHCPPVHAQFPALPG